MVWLVVIAMALIISASVLVFTRMVLRARGRGRVGLGYKAIGFHIEVEGQHVDDRPPSIDTGRHQTAPNSGNRDELGQTSL